MSDRAAAARNLGRKALRRLGAAHKPLVRFARRLARSHEQATFARDASAVDAEIAAVAASGAPIIAGPWLAEVGYEALYWVPFLRWFVDAHRVRPERLTVVSRGGVGAWYGGLAGRYVDIFDLMSPADLAVRNEQRMAAEEGGGRKQSGLSTLDEEILRRATAGARQGSALLHPSLMFRLFRHVWHGNEPFDRFWTRTNYTVMSLPEPADLPGLPGEFVSAKFYSGTALPATQANRAVLRDIVTRLAARTPIVMLDTGLTLDDHEDYTFAGIPNVVSAREWMRPADNLGVQTAVVARSRMFLGTCGGLAWLAPFLGVPTVAVYGDDRQLAPHLFVARQAGHRAGAAEFLPLDLRALERVGVWSLL